MNYLLFVFCALVTTTAAFSTYDADAVVPEERAALYGAFAVSLVTAVSAVAWCPFLFVPGWGERIAAPATLAGVAVTYLLRAFAAPARGAGVVAPDSPPWAPRVLPAKINLAKIVYTAVALAAMLGFAFKTVR